MRAVEHGRSVVHISTVGVSGLITPDGVVHDRSELFTRKVLAGELPLRSAMTMADRWGAIPEYVIGAIAGLLVLIAWRRTRGERATVRRTGTSAPGGGVDPSDKADESTTTTPSQTEEEARV